MQKLQGGSTYGKRVISAQDSCFSNDEQSLNSRERDPLGAPAACLVVEDAAAGAEAGRRGGMDVACVGDASRAKAGTYNLGSITELIDVVK